jgi:uncharacterized membrane protein YbhN (UPF0104 family)
MKIPLTPSHRQTLLRGIGSLLSIALLVYLLSQQGWAEISEALKRISPRTIVIIILLMVVSRLAVASRWYALLRAVAPEISLWESFRMTFAGLFAANFLPTTVGGDILRLAVTLRKAKDRISSGTSIAADRLVGLAGMAMLLPIGVYRFLAWFNASQSGERTFHVSWVSMSLVLTLVIDWRRLYTRLRDGTVRLFRELLLWLRRPKAVLFALCITWVHMTCLFTIIRLLLRDMGQVLDFWTIGGLWSFTYFITLMPVSINGLGLRELSISYIFPELGGVSMQAALSLAILLRGLDLMISLPGSLFLPGVLSEARKDEPGAGPIEEQEFNPPS